MWEKLSKVFQELAKGAGGGGGGGVILKSQNICILNVVFTVSRLEAAAFLPGLLLFDLR